MTDATVIAFGLKALSEAADESDQLTVNYKLHLKTENEDAVALITGIRWRTTSGRSWVVTMVPFYERTEHHSKESARSHAEKVFTRWRGKGAAREQVN